MLDLIRDVRHAARRLVRTPTFTVATLLTLALGIGANTAIFSVVNGVLLRPLPFTEPDRLVGLWQKAPGVNIDDLNACLADYLTYRDHSTTLADVAIWNRAGFTVAADDGTPERVDGVVATFRLLPTLGVQPILGRPFAEGDDASSGPQVAMLGHGYWQRRFGGDPSVIGRRVTIDGTPREIIGVLPQGFWFMDTGRDLILPLRFDRAKVRLAGYNFNAVGRMKPGVSVEQVNADVARMIPLEMTLFPPPAGMNVKQMEEARLAPNVRPLVNDLIGDIGKSLWVIMATIAIVLLIACANVANLLLVRTEGRAQEFAIRSAIGAGRGRLAREVLVESLLLGVVAGVLGIGLAMLALRGVLAMDAIRLPRQDLLAVDLTALAFAFALSVVTSLIFGAIPVMKRTRVNLIDALRAGSRNASASRDRNFTRNALTTVLMTGVPMTGSSSQDPIFASDRTYQANAIPPLRRFITAAPGTFTLLGASLLAGREYDWVDIMEKRPVVLIGDSFAREYWGSAAAAIGKQIRSNPNDPWSEVVGVVADIRHDGVDRPAPSTVYWPLRQHRAVTYLVRSPRAGTEDLASEIRRVAASIGGGVPVTQTRTMEEIYERSMSRTAFTLTLLATSGGMALLLAIVGIYGVISYTVAQRTREIGIRLALGAQHGKLQLMFIQRGLLWSAVGAVAGVLAALPLARAMSSLLFGVSPVDPLTYGVMIAALLAAAALASYIPARRVTRIQPVEALRSE